MKNSTLLISILLALAAVLTVSYLSNQAHIPQEEISPVQPPSPPELERKTIVHYPVPKSQPPILQPAPAEPTLTVPPKNQTEPELQEVLPRVQNSDKSIADSLKNIIPDTLLYKQLHLENFIQRLVSTVDNLPEKRLPQHNLPVYPPDGTFSVSDHQGTLTIAAENAGRYTPYLQILKYAPQDMVLNTYVHYYKLFQDAYRQLGYPNSYFNDRLVFVIDHLLEVPDPTDPLTLEQPVILYTFADPALENLSAGQKILLRLGRQQRLEVLEILRMYRLELVNLKP
jgi:hypothetical protein